MGFWAGVSRFILTRRYLILIFIAGITYFLASQMQYMRFSNTEANLLPKNHEVNIEYDHFLELFGEEGNFIILATETLQFLHQKNSMLGMHLSKKLDSFPEIDFSVALGDIKKLVKNTETTSFDLEPLYDKLPETNEEVLAIKKDLFENLPFFDNFLFNKKSGVIRTAIYMNKDIVNTAARKQFIFNVLNPEIEKFEKENRYRY